MSSTSFLAVSWNKTMKKQKNISCEIFNNIAWLLHIYFNELTVWSSLQWSRHSRVSRKEKWLVASVLIFCCFHHNDWGTYNLDRSLLLRLLFIPLLGLFNTLLQKQNYFAHESDTHISFNNSKINIVERKATVFEKPFVVWSHHCYSCWNGTFEQRKTYKN